jgi:hypothetical protein
MEAQDDSAAARFWSLRGLTTKRRNSCGVDVAVEEMLPTPLSPESAGSSALRDYERPLSA